jgi:hypothetical protein
MAPAMKSLLLPLLAAVALLGAFRPVQAESSEDTLKSAAVAAMLPWLQGIDAGHYGESWQQAAGSFRKALTEEQWIAALDGARKPLGACSKRELASAMYQTDVPQPGGKPLHGQFVVAQFKTSFANLFAAIETVCFEREADGAWRASGYYIKPAT